MEDVYHLGIKALLTNAHGEVLLLKVNPAELSGSSTKSTDYWDLPGGRVQQGTTIEDTLAREVAEETGIANIRPSKHLGMVLSNIRIPLDGDTTAGLILSIYACQLPSGATVVLSKEHIASRWFPAREAAELLRIKYPKEFCNVVASL